jgi:hypothetical protein
MMIPFPRISSRPARLIPRTNQVKWDRYEEQNAGISREEKLRLCERTYRKDAVLYTIVNDNNNPYSFM